MRRSLTVAVAGLLYVITAAAQTYPRIETYLGYNYLRSTHESTPEVQPFIANGGNGQFAFNINKWIGAVADLGANHNNAIGNDRFDSTFFNFIFGPRVSFRNHTRFTPYGQALFGGAYVTQSAAILAVPVVTPLPVPIIIVDPTQALIARVTQTQTGFAMAFGGGLDITISKHIRFRPVEAAYYETRFGNLRTTSDSQQHYLRYSAGINFTFGAQ
jgi:opacity protein-like surface antigen